DGIRDKLVTGVQTCALPIWTRRIKARNPSTRVLILTGHTEFDILTQAATAGASGFLPKESSLQEVIDAIRVPLDDKIVVESSTQIGRASCRERGEMSEGSGV